MPCRRARYLYIPPLKSRHASAQCLCLSTLRRRLFRLLPRLSEVFSQLRGALGDREVGIVSIEAEKRVDILINKEIRSIISCPAL